MEIIILSNVLKTKGRCEQIVRMISRRKAKIGGDELDEKLVEVVSE